MNYKHTHPTLTLTQVRTPPSTGAGPGAAVNHAGAQRLGWRLVRTFLAWSLCRSRKPASALTLGRESQQVPCRSKEGLPRLTPGALVPSDGRDGSFLRHPVQPREPSLPAEVPVD